MEPKERSDQDHPSSYTRAIVEGVGEAGAEIASVGLRALFGVAVLLAGGAVFYALGTLADWWSPGIGLAAVGVGALVGRARWSGANYSIAAVAAFTGAVAALVFGMSTLGLVVFLAATGVAAVALLWRLIEEIVTT